jgi:hypothetical protein
MKKIVFLIMLSTLLLSAAACSSPQAKSTEGLKITGLSTSIGSSDSGTDVQTYSYMFTLQNDGNNEFQIQWVEPVISEAFASKVLDNDLKVAVDKVVSSKQYISISGQFHIDARGLSKEDILKITASQPEKVQISATTVLDLPVH